MKKGKLGAILLALVLIIGLVCCVVCLEKIPAGYVGVVYNMNGGVDGEVLEQGWHLVAPTKKVTKYSIGIEQSYLTAEDTLRHKDKLIIHTTVTGYGHSILEPNVPTLYEEFTAIMELVKAGFPMSRIVVRVDPIIPTEKGLSVAYHTLTSFMEMGFQRYRVSVIDMYPHARSRFKKAGLPLPYGDSGFAPSQAQLSKVDDMLRQAKQFWEGLDNGKVLRIESCAEPGLTEPIACGCISDYDLNLLGFSEDAESNGAGYQRKGCMCYAGKTELLKHKTRCPHGCLYCYWKDIRG